MDTSGIGKNHQEDIKDFVEMLELILNNVYSGIIFCDEDCRIIFMNEVYAQLLGIERHEATDKHIKEFFPESRLPIVVETGKSELGQRCCLKTDPPLLVNRIPIKKGNKVVGVILQTIFRDLSEFKDLISKLTFLEREVQHYKQGLDSVLSARYDLDSIIGQSKAIVEAKKLSEKYAKTDAPVLILGATGTGKELFAHAIHKHSFRQSGPFVCVNSAPIPRELLESELFGYESGAFTGAHKKGKAGKIELSHKGTLFFDEIGELSLDAQAKLLRVIELKTVEKLGGLKSAYIDFRLVAATNKDLKGMIHRGEFREDLFYRINTLTVHVPLLSERVEDIPLLVNYFLMDMGKETLNITEEAMEVLLNYSWPGNVRELRNVVRCAVSLTDDHMIGVEHLPREVAGLKSQMAARLLLSKSPLENEVARCEKSVLDQALRFTKGNMVKASKLLGISRSTLYEKCRRYHLSS